MVVRVKLLAVVARGPGAPLTTTQVFDKSDIFYAGELFQIHVKAADKVNLQVGNFTIRNGLRCKVFEQQMSHVRIRVQRTGRPRKARPRSSLTRHNATARTAAPQSEKECHWHACQLLL